MKGNVVKMIKKLSQKIFTLIMVSLSIIIVGITLLFTYFNYQNTINSRISMMDRFGLGEERRNKMEKPEDIPQLELSMQGVYDIIIENNSIVQSNSQEENEEIEEYAMKLSKTDKKTGIIGNYIYQIRKTKEGNVHITFMEDKNAIIHLKQSIAFSVFLLLIALFIIYNVAKKTSHIIIKPVKETFEKQKQFISDASHELKTPLAVIEANADVLENEIGKSKWLEYIQNEISSMSKLINELLLLAKIENVDDIKQYQDFDLSKETQIQISMFESMAYEKKIKLTSNIQENIKMNGNKQDIEHIVSTLLDNAIKHTDPEKEIIVNLNKEKNEIILEVKNQGEKIIERFYRIDKARNRKEKRYGLGLAIAKSMVEKYKGKIEVHYQEGFTIFNVIFQGRGKKYKNLWMTFK